MCVCVYIYYNIYTYIYIYLIICELHVYGHAIASEYTEREYSFSSGSPTFADECMHVSRFPFSFQIKFHSGIFSRSSTRDLLLEYSSPYAPQQRYKSERALERSVALKTDDNNNDDDDNDKDKANAERSVR